MQILSIFEQLVISAGESRQVVVIFMHNIPSGHETSMLKAVGPNNTDSGCWQRFKQHCMLVTDMTFDERRLEWNEINKNARQSIVEAISSIAAKPSNSYSPHKQAAGGPQHAAASTPAPGPASGRRPFGTK